MRIDPLLIKFFKAAVPDGEPLLDPVEVNLTAMRAGYYVEPGACVESVLDFLRKESVNYNTTFYSSIREVEDTPEKMRLVAQLLHYASTYGTGFTAAEPFTLNPEPMEMMFKELQPIRAVSAAEMYRMCLERLKSPTALKAQATEACCGYAAAWLKKDENTGARAAFSFADIANNEARAVMYNKMDAIPVNAVDLLRLLVYLATYTAELISSRKNLARIANGAEKIKVVDLIRKLDTDRLNLLAQIFYRYKSIFLSIKTGMAAAMKVDAERRALFRQCTRKINYISRHARTYKVPLKPGVLDSVLTVEHPEQKLREAFAKCKSTFRLVRILGYVQMQRHAAGEGGVKANFYVIRNGKLFVDASEIIRERAAKAVGFPKAAIAKIVRKTPHIYNVEYISAVERFLRAEICSRLKPAVEGRKVRFPDDVVLAAPTSEKTFVGSLPVWSSYPLAPENFIGIYWRNEWGTRDFDLSCVLTDSNAKIGWNTGLTADKNVVVHSGDMTNADPEAAEMVYCAGVCPNGLIYVNRYCGEEGSRFRIFFGNGKPEMGTSGSFPGQQFSARPIDVRVEADVFSTSAQQLVGAVVDGSFYFFTLGAGENRVSGLSSKYPLVEALRLRIHSAVDLRQLLTEAGAISWTPGQDDPDIDLTVRNLNSAELLALFER